MHAFLKTGKLGVGSSLAGPSKEKGPKKKAPTPWVEKYRPKTVEDVAYQDEVVAVLKSTIKGADLPNLLFYGPPGTGKTSTILAAARQLFGDLFHQRVLELNASDERGIQVVREKVKNFAQTTVSSTRPDGKPCIPYKIIILDEADSMTNAAQAALRRTMEKQSRTTRFCLICNYVSRIIEPLTSRCSKFRFKPLAQDIMVKRLSYICEEENVKYEDGVLQDLIETSEGDLRRAITTLQSAARLRDGEEISQHDVYEITGVVPVKWLDELFEVCMSNSYEKLSEFLTTMMAEGYSASQIMNQIHDHIIVNDLLSDLQKAAICERLAVCDHRLMDGGDEYVQVLDLSCIVMKQLCHST
ncbi:replication factor C subunit 4-like [Homarus americanus]|uniref:replication factor C subunit 4-like n=1 Tax=Homarus americanus TaxID=6706 RepID=UPI001C4824AF|nr:replication factor C subunit 4-like [Homarus americanus]